MPGSDEPQPTTDFALDRFQLDAVAAVDEGHAVLVSAPTGSGKTVVAEHAVARVLATGRKAFYTTPIKALSNQKYRDLVARHGADRVGLLTGDNAINADAPVVVMTTEVLRNMLYAASPALDGLACVVLDEVHDLQDAYRGAVWEEVIIHTPPDVQLVCLSATVSNAEELAGWIASVRGPTSTIVETHRPVELLHHYLVGDRVLDHLRLVPTLLDGRPNPEGSAFDAGDVPGTRGRGRPRRRYRTPRRLEVVDRLAAEQLLPAIYFVFSRAGCDDAAAALLDSGTRLTTRDEAEQIRGIAERHVEALTDADLDVLHFDRFATALEAGIAAHHAGMVPPFKEAVEECFSSGLVKVVFATETLALGINMPARSVVIENLNKFRGERHEPLTPAEYTQLTGRAGRRGLDPVGHAVVLWSPFVTFDQVAALASSRRFTLTSAFRPTYNMAANLVRRHDPDEAHRLLEQSFAQYQTDASVTRLVARRLERRREVREQQRDAVCELGDVAEYRRLVEGERSNRRSPAARSAIDDAVSRLQPGDIVPASTAYGRAAVLSNTRRHGEARVRLVNPHAKVLTRHARDFEAAPDPIGRIALPEPYRPDDPAFQHEVADLLRRARGGKPHRRSGARDAGSDGAGDDSTDAVPASEQHPVAACPDARRHLRAAAQVERIEVELADLDRRIEGRADSLAHRFDQILQLLEAWSYLDGWALTRRGRQLAGTYHECDLLVVEVLASGLCDDLAPAELAGLISGLTYEHRSRVPAPPPWFPSADLRQRFEQMEALTDALNDDEASLGLPLTRRPDPTFVPLAHAWALGQQLDDVLADEDLTGGDFVRNVRLLIDLLRQVANHADRADTRQAAGAAAEGLFHGVIAASSAVGGAPGEAHAAGPPEADGEPVDPVEPAEPTDTAGPDPA